MAGHLVPWLQRHDRGYVALRRAGRTALITPSVFAVVMKIIGNPTMALFSAFGCVALLMLVNFGGTTRSRLEAQAALSLTGGVFMCVGTLTSRYVWLAVLAMVIVAFVVIFLGVVSSVLAGATTALLLAFILPDSIAAPASEIPERIAGWGIASGAAFLAVWFLWPSPARTPLRVSTAAACRSLATRLTSDDNAAPVGEEATALDPNEPVGALQRLFLATPWRPGGLGVADREVVRLVDEITWASTIVTELDALSRSSSLRHLSHGVQAASADVLNAAATLLDSSSAPLEPLARATDALQAAIAEMEDHLEHHLTIDHDAADSAGSVRTKEELVTQFLSSLDSSFRSREVGYAVSRIATHVERVERAERRSFLDRALGHEPGGTSLWTSTRARITSHLRRHSVWLHNSVRGSVGLAIAVLVAEESGVEHSFWVILGTLSVLRSNALSTGQNALRAVWGTVIGFIVGAALVEAVGTNANLLWFLLPVSLFLAAFMPTAVSFAAGQAGFTLALVILFNILAPVGWRIGLVRVEDIAIGCAVSAGVSLLLWPRGAAAELGLAMREAYRSGVGFLTAAAEHRSEQPTTASPRQGDADEAAAASSRLDDAFRTFVVERGPKPAPLSDVTTLVTGVTLLQLSADAINDLWDRDSKDANWLEARQHITDIAESVAAWYDRFAGRFEDATAIAESPPVEASDGQVVAAVRNSLMRSDNPDLAGALTILWIADHLKVVERLEPVVDGASRVASGLWIPHHFQIPGRKARTPEVTV